MDQDTKVRRYVKCEERNGFIISESECRASGMTVAVWCRTNGYSKLEIKFFLVISLGL